MGAIARLRISLIGLGKQQCYTQSIFLLTASGKVSLTFQKVIRLLSEFHSFI